MRNITFPHELTNCFVRRNVDVYLYQQFSGYGSSSYLATLAEGYPNDREVYYPWTPADTVNPDTKLPYGDTIVGNNYQVIERKA